MTPKVVPSPSTETSSTAFDRRRFIAFCSALGIGSAVASELLWSQAPGADAKPRIDKGMIDQAGTVAGVEIKDEYKEMMLESLNDELRNYKALHDMNIPNSVPPALIFNPVLPGMAF